MLMDKCSGEQHKPVYQEDGITYDTRPVYMDKDVAEPVGSGYPEVIQSASQMGSSLNNPDIYSQNTH